MFWFIFRQILQIDARRKKKIQKIRKITSFLCTIFDGLISVSGLNRLDYLVKWRMKATLRARRLLRTKRLNQPQTTKVRNESMTRQVTIFLGKWYLQFYILWSSWIHYKPYIRTTYESNFFYINFKLSFDFTQLVMPRFSKGHDGILMGKSG